MTQKAISVAFPDGSVISVMQPAATVGYSVVEKLNERLGIIFVCRVAMDANPAVAFNQAEVDMPQTAGFKWISTSAIWNSSGSGCGLNRYVAVEVSRQDGDKVSVRTQRLEDATTELYSRLRDIPAIPYEGVDAFKEALDWLKRREQKQHQAADPKRGSSGMM